MTFRRLAVQGWQQFERVDIDCHERLTVLTGANGSGKTTLLRFLARHFGWGYVQLRTPRQVSQKGLRYYIRFLIGASEEEEIAPGHTEVGSITYSTGHTSAIRIPTGQDEITYQPRIDSPQQVHGLFIPSHRPEFRYQRVEHLPLRTRPWAQDAFSTVQEAMRSQVEGGHGRSSSYHMKEILIGLAVFGYGSQAVEADPVARLLYERFQDALRKILPLDLGFDRLAIRDRAEVVLITRTGDFVLDAVSGGVAALIELAWHVFMLQPPESSKFTVVIDEPENHLHASMQRRLLPSFIEAFPSAQFIVATHSPLIVGSERDSNVFVLRFTSEYAVRSERLDLQDKAGTAEQVLREVLGVEVSIPLWAEQALERTLGKYLSQPLTPTSARALQAELREAGLGRLVPDALVRIADADTQR